MFHVSLVGYNPLQNGAQEFSLTLKFLHFPLPKQKKYSFLDKTKKSNKNHYKSKIKEK